MQAGFGVVELTGEAQVKGSRAGGGGGQPGGVELLGDLNALSARLCR